MPITQSDVEKIAELARLELTADETESFTKQLGSILSYVEKLNEVDTAGVLPMSHCRISGEDSNDALRDDVVRPGIGQQAATADAPDPEAGFFKVPKIIGG